MTSIDKVLEESEDISPSSENALREELITSMENLVGEINDTRTRFVALAIHSTLMIGATGAYVYSIYKALERGPFFTGLVTVLATSVAAMTYKEIYEVRLYYKKKQELENELDRKRKLINSQVC